MSRRIVNLNGDKWFLGQAPSDAPADRPALKELDGVDDWLPAVVPGNVRADLIRAGRLPDLALGRQAEDTRWVDEHCWWYVREVPLSPSSEQRVHLVLRGVDYVSDLYLNGDHLGRHEGMFSPQVYDVSELLRAENRLAVRVVGSRWLPRGRSSPWEQFLNYVESKTSSLSDRFPHRRDVLKFQMSFGWDFAPPLRTMGIWDDVYAVVSQELFIRDIVARQRWVGDEVVLVVEVVVDACLEHPVRLRCTLSGETFDDDRLHVDQIVELLPGISRHTVDLPIPKPRLWWTWDHGRPDLYRLLVELWDGDQCLDSSALTVGLRRAILKGWTLHVNGRPVFARGGNWVPADVLPGRVAEADYRALLNLAREANMNMLRVWGGGLREKRPFYDLCDRMGILVWQEFPFACAFLTRFPRSPDYLRLVEDEVRAIVRDLRNHPSLVLWCGGNEFAPQRNLPLVSTLERVVDDEDSTRPFLRASPANGDSHNWRVWHRFEPPSTYLADTASFASEFGLQAPPEAKTLRRFIPGEDLWPPGQSWAYHGAGLAKLQRYARPFLKEEAPSLETFVRASQRAQAYGLQVAIEHYRRRKAQGCGGVLLWQLNEPWPAISWAILDFFRQPKPAYETVKRLFAPLLISLDYRRRVFQAGDRFEADVWVLNDRAEALPGCRLQVVLRDGAGQVAHRFDQTVDVTANSAEVVGSVCWTLPDGRGWRLDCLLAQGDRILAENEYDLTVHDDIRPTLRQRAWAWLSDLVVPS